MKELENEEAEPNHTTVFIGLTVTLSESLVPQEFDAADRTSYIDDVFALARLDIIKTLKEICINKSLMSNRKYRILIFFLLTV